MLQVRMRVIGINISNGVRTAILEPVRDGGNFLIPEQDQVATGEHISGRLTLTYDTPQALVLEKSMRSECDFILTLAETPVTTDEVLKEAREAKKAEEKAKTGAEALDAEGIEKALEDLQASDQVTHESTSRTVFIAKP